MANRSEASDPAVDELKRRARRRLVGAIVLALAAAVLLPLLRESEPKPLGDDVSIQIPPLDNGKFVNPLSRDKPAMPTAKSDAAGAKSATPAVAPARAPVETPPAGEAKSATPPPSEPRPATEAKTAAPEATPAPAATVAEAKAVPTPATSSADAKSEPSAKDGNAQGNAFVVQVAAFTDRYGALALVRKLKAAGFPSYTEPTTTARGTMHRVRVGPYASRSDADTARAKLKASGYDAMVARGQ
jgi:DedD protein